MEQKFSAEQHASLTSGAHLVHFTELTELDAADALFHAWNTYRSAVGQLLAKGNEGKYVLVCGHAIEGLFDTEEAALTEGYQRSPAERFLVHQVREYEPVLQIRGFNLPWPSLPTPLAKPA